MAILPWHRRQAAARPEPGSCYQGQEPPPQKADGPDLLPGGGLYKIVYFLQLEEDTTFTLARKEIGVWAMLPVAGDGGLHLVYAVFLSNFVFSFFLRTFAGRRNAEDGRRLIRFIPQ